MFLQQWPVLSEEQTTVTQNVFMQNCTRFSASKVAVKLLTFSSCFTNGTYD